jgi:hypothetical protein
MERLLRQGAYGQLMDNDDEASRVFVERDIEEILAKNARQVVMHAFGSSSGLFAKTTFASKASDMELDIDDPSFWKKVLKTRSASELFVELKFKMTNTTTATTTTSQESLGRSTRKKTHELVSNAVWQHKWDIVQNMMPEIEYLVDDMKTRRDQFRGLDSTKSSDIAKLRQDTENLVTLLTEILSGVPTDEENDSVETVREWLHNMSGSRLRRRRQIENSSTNMYDFLSGSDDEDESYKREDDEEWFDDDENTISNINNNNKRKKPFKRRGMDQYLDLLPSVRRVESSLFSIDVVRHCSRCVERCESNVVAQTYETKDMNSVKEMDLVLCAGECGRGFHRACLDDHEILMKGKWTCTDCQTNVHECFVCGTKGLVRGREQLTMEKKKEEEIEGRRRSSRRVAKKKHNEMEQTFAFVRALDNETPREIARKLNVDLKTLIAMNRFKYSGIFANAKLMKDTELDLPVLGTNGWMGRYQVEKCVTCGRYFHPSCLNLPDNTTICCTNRCQSKTCCFPSSSSSSNDEIFELVRCVKCPAAYHVGCLPFDRIVRWREEREYHSLFLSL